jgi:glycogen(starch) synthase
MKILMLGWELPPHISGGLGTACAGLLRGMQGVNDAQVTFVVPRLVGDEDGGNARLIGVANLEQEKLGENGAQAQIATLIRPYMTESEFRMLSELNLLDDLGTAAERGATPDHASALDHGPTIAWPQKSSYSYGLMREVNEHAERVVSNLPHYGEFDVIHAHDWLTYLAAVQIKKLTGKPLVVHVHSTEFDRAGANMDPNIFEVERQGMAVADRIVAVSRYTAGIIADKYGQSHHKMEVVYNAIDRNEEIPKGRAENRSGFNVTFVGRITYQKGPEYFVDAAAMVANKLPDVRFIMAGDGDQLPLMKSLVQAKGISERFEFPGFLSQEGIGALLSKSDVYVMPSFSEPFGISALEAVRAYVPVVLSCNCGVSEVIRNAKVVNAADAEEMAMAIVEILSDRSLAEEMAISAMGELRDLSWEKSARKLHQVYSDLQKTQISAG